MNPQVGVLTTGPERPIRFGGRFLMTTLSVVRPVRPAVSRSYSAPRIDAVKLAVWTACLLFCLAFWGFAAWLLFF